MTDLISHLSTPYAMTKPTMQLVPFLIALFSISLVPSSISSPSPYHFAPKSSSMRGAYWPSWRSSVFPASSINTNYLNHIYYAFLVPDSSTYELIVSESNSKLLADFATALHTKNPPAKALLSIGGGGSNSTAFASMAGSSTGRAAFINSTISVARKHNLDGLDLDWEFPANRQQMADLGLLFSDWRAAVVQEARATGRPRLLLTAAVYFAAEFILAADRRPFPAAAIRDNLDWVNVMCYDYKGSWDTSETGAPAALFDPKSNVSTSFGLRSWLQAGVPPTKLVMGLPLYGRTWKLKDPLMSGIGAPAVGVGPGNDGTMFFYEVVDYNMRNKATEVYDKPTVSTYSHAGTDWIGYDNTQSIAEKVQYARGMGLGGYFFWAVGYDKDWIISRQASTTWG